MVYKIIFVLENAELDAVLVEADSIDSARKKFRTEFLPCTAKVTHERIIPWNMEWSINTYAPLIKI